MTTVGPQTPPPVDQKPSPRWTVILETLFFGIFGLIPAFIGRANARREHRDDHGFFKAFWLTLIAPSVVIIAAAVAVAAATSSGTATANEQQVHPASASDGASIAGASGQVPGKPASAPVYPVGAGPEQIIPQIEKIRQDAISTGSTASLDHYWANPHGPLGKYDYVNIKTPQPHGFSVKVQQVVSASPSKMVSTNKFNFFTVAGACSGQQTLRETYQVFQRGSGWYWLVTNQQQITQFEAC